MVTLLCKIDSARRSFLIDFRKKTHAKMKLDLNVQIAVVLLVVIVGTSAEKPRKYTLLSSLFNTAREAQRNSQVEPGVAFRLRSPSAGLSWFPPPFKQADVRASHGKITLFRNRQPVVKDRLSPIPRFLGMPERKHPRIFVPHIFCAKRRQFKNKQTDVAPRSPPMSVLFPRQPDRTLTIIGDSTRAKVVDHQQNIVVKSQVKPRVKPIIAGELRDLFVNAAKKRTTEKTSGQIIKQVLSNGVNKAESAILDPNYD